MRTALPAGGRHRLRAGTRPPPCPRGRLRPPPREAGERAGARRSHRVATAHPGGSVSDLEGIYRDAVTTRLMRRMGHALEHDLKSPVQGIYWALELALKSVSAPGV